MVTFSHPANRVKNTHLIRAYSVVTRVLAPLLPLWLQRRARRGKEDPLRLGERLGVTHLNRPEGPIVWMHGASVGECLMLLPVIERFLAYNPALHVLVTSGTTSSAAILSERLPPRTFHQYVPLDTPKAVNVFLTHWHPDVAIWAESEIWPNLIIQTHKRAIPMALINARMSEKSFEGWRKRPKSAKALFACFDKILTADENTAHNLTSLLGTTIEASGNLKDAAPPLPVNPAELTAFHTLLNNRPIWCAASTHTGEDMFIIEAHQHIRQTHETALLILAPRHPERRDAVINLLKSADISYCLRSEGLRPKPSTSVYLFDSLGEMGLAYSLSDISFIGGSLIAGMSGHNPLEPARLRSAVLTGPHISSFADTYMSMFAFNAAKRIFDPALIGSQIAELFDKTSHRDALIEAGYQYAGGRDAVLDYVWTALTPLFEARF